jgi:hypothetical protein
LGCADLAATIQVSDQPVDPSSGTTAPTGVSSLVRFAITCQVVPITDEPLLKALTSLV